MYDSQESQEALMININEIFPNVELKGLYRIPSYRNIVILAKTDNDDLVFKLAPLNSCNSLQREYQAINILYSNSGPVPCPVYMENEHKCQVIWNAHPHIVRGYKFIKGNSLALSEKNFYSLGVSIASLHNAWETSERPSWIPEMNVLDIFNSSIEAIREKYNVLEKIQIVEQLSSSVSLVLEAHRVSEFLGLSHGDAHHLNAIQTSIEKTILIDLEDVCWQWRVYDLATAIWGTFSQGGNVHIWNELIAGYNSVRPISQEEAYLIRFLIFTRHLWWLGLWARNWNQWPHKYTCNSFFKSGIELLMKIAKDICGLTLQQTKKPF